MQADVKLGSDWYPQKSIYINPVYIQGMATIAEELKEAVNDILANVSPSRLGVECWKVQTLVSGNTDVVQVEIVLHCDITEDFMHDNNR